MTFIRTCGLVDQVTSAYEVKSSVYDAGLSLFYMLFLLRFYFGPKSVKVTWIRFWNRASASGDVSLCLFQLTKEIIVRAVIEFLKQFAYRVFSLFHFLLPLA